MSCCSNDNCDDEDEHDDDKDDAYDDGHLCRLAMRADVKEWGVDAISGPMT